MRRIRGTSGLLCLRLLPLLFAIGGSACCFAQHTLHVSVSGSDRNSGTALTPLRTISAAAKLARAGDVVTVHAGIYRELVDPAFGGLPGRPIVYRAGAGEKVEIRGSEEIRGWRRLADGSWKVVLPDRFFGNYNPFKDLIYGDWFFPGPRKLHTGEVYLEGKALLESEHLTAPMSWACLAAGDSTVLYANFGKTDPNIALVEINVRQSCFYPSRTGVNYLTVSGFHMSQAATQWAAPTAEQVGLIGTNWSKGWVIENNVISDSKCAGITLGKDRGSGHNVWSSDMNKDGSLHYNEMVLRVIAAGWNKKNIGSHVVRGNTVFNCGAAGICGSFGAAYSKILKNHIYDIYTRRNFGGAEMAGIKIHGAIDVLISGNRIHHAFIGIWLDWMAQGTRLSRNLMYANDYVDFFPEVNHGPYLVDNNVLASDFSLRDWSEGGAFVHNLFAGILSRAPQSRTTPYFNAHGTMILGVDSIKGGNSCFYNNVFMGKPDISIYRQPKMHAFDTPDLLSGYGLAIYKDAAFPVEASGNKYLEFARIFVAERKAPEGIISSAMLSKAVVPGLRFELPDARSVLINTDFEGRRRSPTKPSAGPFEGYSGSPAKKIKQLIQSDIKLTQGEI